MKPHLVLSTSLAFLVLALAACSDLGPTADGLAGEVAAQRRIWEAWRPESYTYDVERLCFCAVEARGPVRVVVREGQVLSRRYVEGERPVSEDYLELFPGVEGLFDVLADAAARDAHQVQVTWDPVRGAPQDFWIDYDARVADEELGFRIVRPPSPSSP
jgi:hypothetical protein